MNCKTKIIFLFVLCLAIHPSISTVSFIYPYSLSLSDTNILIIHKFGISICDALVSKIVNNVISFSEDEQITEESLSKITCESKNKYISCIINDKIYIFDNVGNSLYKSISSFLENDECPDYYSLIPIKEDNDQYHYIIGFVDNNLLSLIYYIYNNQTKMNEISYARKNEQHKYFKVENYVNRVYDTSYNINNKGLTCQFLNSIRYGDVLTCVFLIYIDDYYITFDYFKIEENTTIYEHPNFISDHFAFENFIWVKSVKSSNNSVILSYIYLSSGLEKYVIFNVNKNYRDLEYYSYENKNCINNYYGSKINYFQEKEEFVFSCLVENRSIFINYFDKEFNNNNSLIKFNDCENIYGYSILYSNSSQKYFTIADGDCIIQIEKEEEEKEKEEEGKIEEEKERKEEEVKTDENIETIIGVEEEDQCEQLEKCQKCNEESVLLNLCIKCNIKKGYYYQKYILLNSKFIENDSKYIECVNSKTKPSNFYFNEETKISEPCFYTCATCNYGGDGNQNNCTSCATNFIKRNDFIDSTNCIIKCLFYYYHTPYKQYKCTEDGLCPEKYNLLIEDKGKCIEDCGKDDIYKYQYNGKCLKECPINTESKNNDNICKDIDLNKCILNENNFISLVDNLTDNEIEYYAKNYAKEFYYTKNHISIFKNDIYSLIIYKNSDCISELSLEISKIDFGECYSELKDSYNDIDNDIVIVIVNKKIKELNYSKIIFFSMFHPITGEKLSVSEICKDDILLLKENLMLKIDYSKIDLDTILFFTNQGIDIFNLSHSFYNDICYDFDSPTEKDIALKDRIFLFFPNITLCENDCEIKGINLTTFESICECKAIFLLNNNSLIGNILSSSQFAEIENMISQTNINIVKCYHYFLVPKSYYTSIGFFIIIVLNLIQLIFISFYFCRSVFLIKKYIFNITDKLISFLNIQKKLMVSSNDNYLYFNDNLNINSPPKRNSKAIDTIEKENKKVTIRNTKKSKTKRDRKINPILYKKNSFEKEFFDLKNKKKTKKYKDNFNNENSPKTNNAFINSNNNMNSSDSNSRKETSIKNKYILEEMNVKSNDEIKINLSSPNQATLDSSLISKNIKEKIDFDAEEYLSTEYDDMEYDDAIKKDKRKFCTMYFNRLKVSHIILSTFYENDPLIPRAIKILLLILDIELYLVINGLFFNEDYISNMFFIGDEDNIFTFIERMMNRFFYTSLVGIIVNYIVEFFFIDEKKIKRIFKREKNNIIILKYEMTQIIKVAINRYKIFILLSLFINIISLYYLICFNNVYPSMKKEWIISSVIIILAMQIISALGYLLESFLRFISFKCKSEKIYSISKLLS